MFPRTKLTTQPLRYLRSHLQTVILSETKLNAADEVREARPSIWNHGGAILK
jgi:hypothetical protein